MHRSLRFHLLVFLGLALAAGALFFQVIDTGFWSPEDFHELMTLASAKAADRLTFAFQPILAGGYRTNPIFVVEFQLFGMNAMPYYLVNIVVIKGATMSLYTWTMSCFWQLRPA